MKRKKVNTESTLADPEYDARFAALTWDDLEYYAGERSVKRGKGYVSRVSRICVDGKGAVIASVQGRDEYATKVWFDDDGKLHSDCSCPVGFACKHAVALTLKVIDDVKAGWKPSMIAADDERLDEFLSVDEDFDEDLDENEEGNTGTRGASARAPRQKPDRVLAYLLDLKPSAAKDILVEIAAQFDVVRTELRRRIELAKSDVDALADKAKKAIRDATATACRFYVWGDRDRSIYPDYGEARQFLERLLELKAYDKLIALADYLTKRAVAQMEMSENDEGQIGYEADSCMEVIAKAVMLSGMSDMDKILWFHNLHDTDEYCFYEDIKGTWGAPKSCAKSAWAEVADVLSKELSSQGDVGNGFSIHGRHLSSEIEVALKFAGRRGEVMDFKKRAVAKTGDYNTLVQDLIEGGDLKEAKEWCLRGIKEQGEYGKRELRGRLIEIAEREKNPIDACSYLADAFFDSPWRDSYEKLMVAARKADVYEEVHKGALDFLEKGVLPWEAKKSRWPLPKLLEPSRDRSTAFPRVAVLIDVALMEDRLEDAIKWYASKGKPTTNFHSYLYRGTEGDQGWDVAEKVASRFPDEAISIWLGLIAANRGKTGNGHYDQIAQALGNMRPVMERIGRLDEWKALIAEIRTTDKGKRNLMKILDGIERGPQPPKPIIADR